MATMKDMCKKYYKEPGDLALNTRLNTLLRLFKEEKEYPFKKKMLGFPDLYISSKEELFYRMKELCDLLGRKMAKEVDKNG